MALVLSLKPKEDFYVGDQRFIVTKLYNRTSFTLVHEGGKQYEITEYEATEVLPDVWVSSGDVYDLGTVRVVIEAPREILILRGEKVREKPRAHEHA
jgi:hypothetical protein